MGDPVESSFIKIRVIVNSKDCLCREGKGTDSVAYNKIGKHLAFNKLITTSSDASLPILPKIQLNPRKNRDFAS